MAIEIEKKFLLSTDDETSLLADALSLGEKVIIDSYYDNPAFSLTSRDLWLRRRDETFELKTPLARVTSTDTNQYHELTSDDDILAALELPASGTLAETLAAVAITPFLTARTTRRSYQKTALSYRYRPRDVRW